MSHYSSLPILKTPDNKQPKPNKMGHIFRPAGQEITSPTTKNFLSFINPVTFILTDSQTCFYSQYLHLHPSKHFFHDSFYHLYKTVPPFCQSPQMLPRTRKLASQLPLPWEKNQAQLNFSRMNCNQNRQVHLTEATPKSVRSLLPKIRSKKVQSLKMSEWSLIINPSQLGLGRKNTDPEPKSTFNCSPEHNQSSSSTPPFKLFA